MKEMHKEDQKYQAYIAILKEELVPAMGCTEPIALAYGAALARDLLGEMPSKVDIQVSGSIIKNVKSVIVPNTGHLKGIKAAIAAGLVTGDATQKLECIAHASQKEQEIASLLDTLPMTIHHIENGHVFDIIIRCEKEAHYSLVHICDDHTNVIRKEKDHQVLFTKESAKQAQKTDRSLLDMESIYDFINTVEIDEIAEVLERQIAYNTAIAEEGLTHDYGANIGKVLMSQAYDLVTKAKAYAAAGSDARMNGCELPVVINSGSGNQGLTCSLPVLVYAKAYHVSHERLLRALALSNLVAIHEKTGIGTLSAYCGAVTAGAGAGAGIAYLLEGDYKTITHTIVNSLAIVSGMICDGAKASCAAKIASSVDAAMLGYEMYKQGQQFKGGDGIVVKGIEKTLDHVGRLGREGMKETNKEIIAMMIDEE